MDEKILDYLSQLRDFGRLYTQKLLNVHDTESFDFRLAQIKALYAFRENDNLTMKELANNIGVKLPNMTMMIDNLEKQGFVQRGRDDFDRRKVIVRLTREGKKYREDFLDHRNQVADSLFSTLGKKELEEFLVSLERVCVVFKKAFSQEKKPTE